jgi:hypothetical protein
VIIAQVAHYLLKLAMDDVQTQGYAHHLQKRNMSILVKIESKYFSLQLKKLFFVFDDG